MAMQTIDGAFSRGTARTAQAAARKPLLRRFIEALMEAQARRAEREVALFLQTRGWNDATEREIERRFIHRGSGSEER